MARRIREHDWAATPLGPIEGWPAVLRVTVDVLLAHGFAMIALWGPELIQIYNDRYAEIMGDRHPAGLGRPTRAVWPEVWHINEPIYRRVRAGETVTLDDALFPIRRGATIRDAWFTLTYSPLRDGADPAAGILVTVVEVTTRVLAIRAERADEVTLRRDEERHRAELEMQVRDRTAELQASRDLVQATVDASPDMIQVFEAVRDTTGTIVDFRWLLNNRTSAHAYGEVRGESLLQRNPGVVVAGIFDIFCQVIETGEPRQVEHHYVHEQFNGWFFQSVVKLGDGVATTTADITDRKRGEEELLRLRDTVAREQAVLIEELQHRTRNLLTVTGAVADRTLSTSRTLEEFGERFEQRLAALGRVQGLLSRAAAPRVTVAELVDLELSAHAIEADDPRVDVGGPDLPLPPAAVQLLALALHELSTNAIKHGAVRHGGELAVSWSTTTDDRLHVLWVERQVAAIGPVTASGFGRQLIERTLPYELDADTSFAVTQDGLRCSITFALSKE